MSAKKIFYLPGLAFFLYCCTPQENPENKALEKQLYGEWFSVSLKLVMNTYNNTKAKKEFEVKEGEWEQKMKMRSISTFYKEDGTYSSAHFNLHDSLFYMPAGRWKIVGDTIFMHDTFPELGLTYRYKVAINKDTAEFTGIEDCDGDGKYDDNYSGVQHRFPK
jgi:hypothetical protein